MRAFPRFYGGSIPTETANRSLEEIDIIFAKGYVEGISYVKAAEQMPFLTQEQVEQEAVRLGLVDSGSQGGMGEKSIREDSYVDTVDEAYNSDKKKSA